MPSTKMHTTKTTPTQSDTTDRTHSPITLRSLRPLLGFIRPYKLVVLCALLALFFTAFVSLSIGYGIKAVIDQGFVAGSPEQLQTTLLILIAMITLMTLGTFFRFYLMSWIGERVSADLRSAVFAKLVVLHPSYFEENRSGELMSRLTTDTTLLQSIVGSSFSMALRSSVTLIGGLIMLCVTNIKLTLIVIAVIPLILLPVFILGKRVRRLAANSQDAIADISTYAGEIIQNIKVVQSYTHEQREQDAFNREVENAFSVAKQRILQRALLITGATFLAFIAISVMLGVGGMDVLNNRISVGDLGAFVFYAIMVAMSFATIAEVYGEVQRAAGAASRLMALLGVESAIQAPIAVNTINLDNSLNIDIRQLSFHYPSRPLTPALNAIDLSIIKGEVIAIVGPSGAGKSTLFDLLQRFYDPTAGHIEINQIDIKTLSPTQLRSYIGTVPQQPVLFSSDVMHNIRYGAPSASDEQVIEAAQLAHADDFIRALPQGYQSFLGERGVRLSGGQKQRIAIARAILKNPRILLLDEATSALDSESEQQVQAALQTLMQSRTTLIIAHRLATVLHADKIIVMEEGQIKASGTHAQLLKNNPLYQRLCALQFQQHKNTSPDIK